MPRIRYQMICTIFLVSVAPQANAQTWTALQTPPPTGLAHCLLLTDGTVLCQSSTPNHTFYRLTPDIQGNYINGSWSAAASIPVSWQPVAYGSAVLADGRVLLVGGEYDGAGAGIVMSNRCAVYNPVTNSWAEFSPPPGMPYIGDAQVVVLPDGRAVVGSKLDKRLAVLNPATLTWTVIDPAGKLDAFNSEATWSLLPDGTFFGLAVQNAPIAERYFPSTSTWVSAGPTPFDMHLPGYSSPITIAPGVIYNPPGEVGPILRRPNGTYFVEGGNGRNAVFTPPPANSATAGSWAAGPDFPNGLAVDDGSSAMLPNGHVLSVTSPPFSRRGLAFYEFDGTNLISVPNIPNAAADASNYTSILLLPTGQVMLVDTSNIVEIYTPTGTHDPSWAPAISSVSASLTSGQTYPISGTQFNGISQGTGSADENQNATNYPLVRITNNASGHVFYARTRGHSTMGIATGATPVSTTFDVPLQTELGLSSLSVVANGIPSVPTPVTIFNTSPPPLSLACPAASAQVNIPYTSAVAGIGGQPPFHYTLVNGSLPVGFTFDPNTGAIGGLPTVAGVANFSITMSDSYTTPGTRTADCSIDVSLGPAVGFQGFDIVTQGSWKGVHGQDGWIIASHANNPPAYATVTRIGGSEWTWNNSTTDTRALQKPASATDRIASTFYSTTSFSFDINFTDGQTHQIALYALDYDSSARTQTVTILNSFNHTLLDTRNMSFMQGGQYAVWNVKGHVILQVTYTGGLNAVGGGLFFRTPPSGIPAPAVSVTSPAPGPVTGSVTMNADATSAAGIQQVQFLLDNVNFGAPVTGSGPTFSKTWDTTATSNGAHSITAIAKDGVGQQTTSASVAVTVSNAIVGNAATFVSLDSTTTGNWKGVYGQDGYIIANDSNVPPAYATITSAGASVYSWSASTTDPRALRKGASATDRIASTYYSSGFFTFDIAVGASPRQLALYFLDWETSTRSQTVTFLDPVTNAVLSTRSIGNFRGGVFGIWSIQGRVLVRITNTGSPNAVVSGLFFGAGSPPPPPPAPPAVSITSPGAGTVSGQFAVSATATSTAGIASVQFKLDDNPLGALLTGAGPYSIQWNSASSTNGSHSLTAVATDTVGQATTSAAVAVTVANSAPSGATASFVKFDSATQGSWKGTYGADGYWIANHAISLPGYASASTAGSSLWTWATSSTDPRALQKPASATDRIVSAFYSGSTMTFDVTLTGPARQVALYSLDFDSTTRSQRFDLLDAVTQAPLNSQTLSGFRNGVWAVWNIQGHVLIRVTNLGSPNAAVSGLFFAAIPSSVPPPTVNVTSPAAGPVTGTISLGATAASSIGIASLRFQLDGVDLGSSIPGAGPFTMSWNSSTTTNGAHTLRSVATDTQGQSTNSAGVAVTVSNAAPAGPTVVFLGKDTTTAGSWKGKYGQDGYLIANDGNSPPAYAPVTFTGATAFTWLITQDPRALQQAAGAARIASTYYAASVFTMDVNATGGAHKVALYFLDWDGSGRAETVSVIDAATQQVLNTQSISSFQQGAYLSWNITGHVLIRIQRTAGPNAAASGIFFGPAQ